MFTGDISDKDESESEREREVEGKKADKQQREGKDASAICQGWAKLY